MKKKSQLLLGLIQVLLSVFWIYQESVLYYEYHFTDILFMFRFPDWVIYINVILSVINLYFGVKLIKELISVKQSYIIMIILIVMGGIINMVSVA